jgi:hypothetical protein
MKRRTLLQSLAATVFSRPLFGLRLSAQAAGFTTSQLATLTAIAEVVLPTSLGADGRDLVVERFAGWVRGYREGADMGHGYGSSTLRRPSGPSPAADYPAQIDALEAAARGAGGTSFAALPLDRRRAVIEPTMNGVSRMPSQPNGQSLVADFMGLYYSSPEAWDLAYARRIGRDRCRTLEGSETRPAPIGGEGGRS